MLVDQRHFAAVGGHELLHHLVRLGAVGALEIREFDQHQLTAELTAQRRSAEQFVGLQGRNLLLQTGLGALHALLRLGALITNHRFHDLFRMFAYDLEDLLFQGLVHRLLGSGTGGDQQGERQGKQRTRRMTTKHCKADVGHHLGSWLDEADSLHHSDQHALTVATLNARADAESDVDRHRPWHPVPDGPGTTGSDAERT